MALISTVPLRHSAATATTIFRCRSLLFSSATKPRQSSSWPYFRWNKKFSRPTTIHLESRETNCPSLTVLRNAAAPSQTTLSHVSTQGQTSIKGSHSVGLKEESAVGSRDEGGGSVDTSGGSKGKGEGGERGGGGGAGVGENDGETRPYTTIPGPKPLPLIGNKLLFTPLGGYSLEQFWATCWRLYREFGPIVRLSGVMGDSDLVMVFKPDDTRKIFQVEGTHPIRPALDVLAYYRQQRPEWYTSVGLVPGNGEEWYRLRAGVHSLLRRVVVTKYRLPQALVARDLVTHLTWKLGSPAGSQHLPSQNQVVEDVLPILFRYTLEAVGLVALGIRLGCLEKEGDLNKTTEDNKNENLHDAESIINANEEVLTALGESLFFHPPFYKIFPTKIYKTVAKGQDTIARVVMDELWRRKEERARFPEEFSEKHPFLESLMAKKDFTDSDIFLLLVEVFQGGIDATATTLAFCLYFIAKDPKVQETLYEEVKEVDLTSHTLQGLVYLRAVLQETMRLRPSASASTRLTQRDMVFSGYHVPAGTFVSSPPVVSCHDPNEFPEPDLFLPQRWLIRRRRQRGEQLPTMTPQGRNRQEGSVHPYAVLPFGHGARMCPGRRLAEQEVFLAIIQIVQYFKLESASVTNETKTVGQVMRMNMMPDSAISIRFVPRP